MGSKEDWKAAMAAGVQAVPVAAKLAPKPKEVEVGADVQTWAHTRAIFGKLEGELIPIVADLNAQPSEGSRVKQFDAKMPSEYVGVTDDGVRIARGLAGSLKTRDPAVPAQLDVWQRCKLGPYNIGVNARAVRALDVDVVDPELATEIAEVIASYVTLPKRARANSSKFLQPFLLEGEHKKRVIETRAGRIEFLGNGQQWVFAGTHKSGAALEWQKRVIGEWKPGAPTKFTSLSVEQFEDLWRELRAKFEVAANRRPPASAAHDTTSDDVPESRADLDELRDLLTSRDLASYESWIEALQIVHHETAGGEDGLALAIELSEPHWQADRSAYASCGDEVEAKWPTFGNTPTPRTVGSLRREQVASRDDFDDVPASVAGEPGETPLKPVVDLAGGKLSRNVRQCTEILADELYKRGQTLVRVGEAGELDENESRFIRRVDTQPVILQVSPEYVQLRLTDLAIFERWDARAKEHVRKDCPRDVATGIAKSGDWPTLSELRAIATAPFIRPDMTVCAIPGYDASARVFYAPNEAFPLVPDEPSQDAAAKALVTLLAPFSEFPMTAEARAAFVSHILTEAVRLAIDTAPLFAYTAPEAGTGKSLLAEMPARIVHGVTPAMRAWASDNEEIRKVLFASLLAGDRTIGFDNIPSGSKVRTSELARFATSEVYSDRRLGVSETVAIANRAVVFLTGNNITPTSDLARRSIVVRLNANVDSRELRERRFTIDDLRGHVREHRTELLIAALTIVRAFIAAGAPRQAAFPLPSFERWSHLVRDPLIWLGLPDPLVTQDTETDNESGPFGEAIAALAAAFGGEPFTSADVHRRVEVAYGSVHELRTVLIEAGCTVDTAKGIGMWLRGHKDRVSDGMTLEVGTASEARRCWRIKGGDGRDLI